MNKFDIHTFTVNSHLWPFTLCLSSAMHVVKDACPVYPPRPSLAAGTSTTTARGVSSLLSTPALVSDSPVRRSRGRLDRRRLCWKRESSVACSRARAGCRKISRGAWTMQDNGNRKSERWDFKKNCSRLHSTFLFSHLNKYFNTHTHIYIYIYTFTYSHECNHLLFLFTYPTKISSSSEDYTQHFPPPPP